MAKRVNSKAKGARGERELVKYLKSLGFEDAKRTQQYNGLGRGDVECPDTLPGLNVECKFGYPSHQFDMGSALFHDACAQAERDSMDGRWVMMWKPKGGQRWRITYRQDDFLPTLTGDTAIKSTLEYVACTSSEHIKREPSAMSETSKASGESP